MSRRAQAAGLIVLFFWPAALAQSWTDATRSRMVRDALKISPPALSEILEHFEKDLLRGMLEPLYRASYSRYIERMLDRIPFVVDRDPPPTLEKDDIQGFVMDIARRAGRNYALIGPAFKDDGTPKSPSALDERSVPFGIASLSYSHSTSDIAWIWRHLWVSINGDMRGTPFLGAPPPEKVQVPPRPPKPKRKAPPAARTSPAPGPQTAATASPAPSPKAASTPSAAPQSTAKPSPSPQPS